MCESKYADISSAMLVEFLTMLASSPVGTLPIKSANAVTELESNLRDFDSKVLGVLSDFVRCIAPYSIFSFIWSPYTIIVYPIVRMLYHGLRVASGEFRSSWTSSVLTLWDQSVT